MATLTPVPFYPVKFLALSSGFSEARYLSALMVGRLPRRGHLQRRPGLPWGGGQGEGAVEDAPESGARPFATLTSDDAIIYNPAGLPCRTGRPPAQSSTDAPDVYIEDPR